MVEATKKMHWLQAALYITVRDAMVVELWESVKFTGPKEGRRFADAWLEYWDKVDKGGNPEVDFYSKKASRKKEFQTQFMNLVAKKPKGAKRGRRRL